MAYQKLNWLNKGETGAKPINKTNLNHMDDGIGENDIHIGDLSSLNTNAKDNLVGAINEINSKNSMITAFSPEVNGFTGINDMTFGSNIKVGNRLSVSGNKIVVGDNVNYILISANFTLQASEQVTNGQIVNIITKNDIEISRNYMFLPSLATYYTANTMTVQFLAEVNKNDEIGMKLESNFTGRLLNSEYGKTYITVIAI